jgi:hypothetical protein
MVSFFESGVDISDFSDFRHFEASGLCPKRDSRRAMALFLVGEGLMKFLGFV